MKESVCICVGAFTIMRMRPMMDALKALVNELNSIGHVVSTGNNANANV